MDPQPTPTPTPAPAPIPEETLKSALSAFRKRLKLTRLDHESKLGGHRPTSSGKKTDDSMGIIPPNQFPPPVWKELARLGRLKDMGGGFYRLP